MKRIFGAPRRYVQGAGALDELGEEAMLLGTRAFVIADPVAFRQMGAELRASLDRHGCAFEVSTFGGECSAAEISRQSASAQAIGADLVIGVGGGKAIDTAKATAQALGCRVAIVPTIASNDSPTSRLAVIYDDQQRISEVRFMRHNPDLVLVDTAVIASAPSRFLAAGIGDALSKRFEAAQCALAGGQNFFGASPLAAGQFLADGCYSTVRTYGVEAMRDVENRRVTDAVEKVVEANVLLSGLGFENGGLSVSHALLRGMSQVPHLSNWLHGEQVAYALLVQLTLEEREADEIADLAQFLRQIGLPTSIQAKSTDARTIDYADIADATLKAPYIGNFQKKLARDDLVNALISVESNC